MNNIVNNRAGTMTGQHLMKWLAVMVQSCILLMVTACGEQSAPEAEQQGQPDKANVEQTSQQSNDTSQLNSAGKNDLLAQSATQSATESATSLTADNQKLHDELVAKNEHLKAALKDKGVAGGDCASTSIKACLRSAACVVEQQADRSYQCRDAANSCEIGFVQDGGKDLKESCEAKGSCQFKPASCYCPPGVTCVCGGGAPAACLAIVD